ncbi:NADH-quinone oxidoreductase subunit NuoK [Streptomyces sp. NPDC059740]|uniref:NADH-quinone oxidoreductase subunit NuoK n=1 Tax=Streptomyces sp. NPDC059740 TaxID=3346926 RepID=UPI00364E91A9
MHLAYPAVLAVLLFCVGVYGVLARRNAILVLMSVELMLNAVNLNLVAFDVWLRDTLHAGQALTLFTIAIAAAEIGIGLAVVLLVHRNRGTADVDRLRDLREEDPHGDARTEQTDAGPDAVAQAALLSRSARRTAADAHRRDAAHPHGSPDDDAEATA